MVHIQIDINNEQHKKVEILKSLKNLKNKQESVKEMIDEYDIKKILAEEVKHHE